MSTFISRYIVSRYYYKHVCNQKFRETEFQASKSRPFAYTLSQVYN